MRVAIAGAGAVGIYIANDLVGAFDKFCAA